MIKNRIFVTLCILLSSCNLAYSSPWFTGPLLAPAGITVPLGHANFEIYGFSTSRSAIFDKNGKKIHVPTLESWQTNPLLTYGLANNIDVQLSVPFTRNHTLGQAAQHIGDTSILLGFQAMKQHPGSVLPNLRVTLQEVIPTGRFDYLNPTDKGVGVTGGGDFQSVLTLTFQELTQLTELHYLRTRLALAYMYSCPHPIHGKSGLGGGPLTRGREYPGDLISADLAGELTLTQQWVAVMEMYYMINQKTSFRGTTGYDENGLLIPTLGNPQLEELSLAPAIEYNFTANYGVIAGVWLAVQGRNAPVFTSAVIAFNAYF